MLCQLQKKWKKYILLDGTRRLMPESCMLKDLSKLIFYSSSQLYISPKLKICWWHSLSFGKCSSIVNNIIVNYFCQKIIQIANYFWQKLLTGLSYISKLSLFFIIEECNVTPHPLVKTQVHLTWDFN